METKIPGISIAKPPKEDAETTSRDYLIMKADGVHSRVEWLIRWWDLIKIYLPFQIQPALKKFWSGFLVWELKT